MKRQICYFCKEEIEGFANTIGDIGKEDGKKRESTVCCDKCYSKVLKEKLENSNLLNSIRQN